MKFIIDNIWLIGLALISGGGLLWLVLERRGKEMSLFEATQLLNKGNVAVLDVRDADDFAQGHLRGAKNIPHRQLASRGTELEPFKSKSLLVVCKAGVQAPRVITPLRKMGFDEVYILSGGITAWTAQGLPTTTK